MILVLFGAPTHQRSLHSARCCLLCRSWLLSLQGNQAVEYGAQLGLSEIDNQNPSMIQLVEAHVAGGQTFGISEKSNRIHLKYTITCCSYRQSCLRLRSGLLNSSETFHPCWRVIITFFVPMVTSTAPHDCTRLNASENEPCSIQHFLSEQINTAKLLIRHALLVPSKLV